MLNTRDAIVQIFVKIKTANIAHFKICDHSAFLDGKSPNSNSGEAQNAKE